MKEKFAASIIMAIMAFFVGFLFLRGERVINGQAANDFKLVAFATSGNAVSNDNLSTADAFIDTKSSGIKHAKVEFYVNDEMIDEVELALAEGINEIKLTEKVIFAFQKRKGENFKYELRVLWNKKSSDQIEKMIIAN